MTPYDDFFSQLAPLGIDIEDALLRLNGNTKLFKRILGRYLKDVHYDNALEAFRTNDLEGAFRAVHTLKGVAGNLSVVPLYEAASSMTECLRVGNWEEAGKHLPALTEAHERLKSGLAALFAERTENS